MAVTIPEGIPDSVNLPDNLYDFKVESFEPVETQTGKLAVKASLRVLAPKSHKGLTHFEQFTIGSNDDPQARESETWLKSFGAIALQKFVKKAGVKFGGRKLEDVAAEMEGQKVSARVVYTVDGRKFLPDGTENPYYGNSRSQAKEWFETGEKTAGDPQYAGGGKSGTKGAAAAPKKAPKAPPPPADDDDDDEAPPAKVKKAKPAPEPEEEDDDEEDEAPPAKSKSGNKKPNPVPVADDDDDEDDDD